jgi:cytochrome c oxidase assembly protein subunit 15
VGLHWLRRYAVFVACCTFALVIAGAEVASNDAALSVPDWPLSWGHLVPTLEGGIRYEFAHRVAAMLVGLLTLGLALWMQRASAQCHILSATPANPQDAVGRTPWSARDALVPLPERRDQHLAECQQADGGVGRGPGGPPHLTRLAWAAVVVVVMQAALGGIAVRFIIPAWATIAHAALGQLFFAIMVAICVRLYAPVDGTWAAPTLICTVALFAQTILGAGVRYGVVAAVAHIVGAVLATILVMWAALSILMQQMENPKLRRAAMLLLSITFSQVFLGIAAMMTRIVYANAPQPMPVMVLFTVAHVAVGSLALGAAVALTMLAPPDVFRVQGEQVTA